jgi:myo-inositol 2-dehydrogenase/D-chiro-inositol 1-dehydrogenase
MRIGVIGLGRIGQFHARVLKKHPEVSALVVSDTDGERVDQLAKELGAVGADIDSLLGQVDAVVITSPTNTHAEMIHRTIDAGKPTFCEKPVALDLESTRAVVRKVRETAATVQIGFQRRFDVGYRAARDAVRDGTLGKVYTVRFASHDPYPPHESYLPGSGGIFRDMHIHDFDVVPWVIGQDITEVYVKGAVLVDPMFSRNNDFDTVAGTFEFSDGALGVLTGARHDPPGHDVRLEVFGSRDSVVAGWDDRTPMRSLEPGVPRSTAKPYEIFLDRFAPAYAAELNTFVDVAQGKMENPCSVEDAEKALCVAVACNISQKENRPVRISEVTA